VFHRLRQVDAGVMHATHHVADDDDGRAAELLALDRGGQGGEGADGMTLLRQAGVLHDGDRRRARQRAQQSGRT
jgi:hypothetical protein